MRFSLVSVLFLTIAYGYKIKMIQENKTPKNSAKDDGFKINICDECKMV